MLIKFNVISNTTCFIVRGAFFFFKQKTAYEIVSGDWSSDVCSSDLRDQLAQPLGGRPEEGRAGSEVELLRCRIGLEESVDPVLERAALPLRHPLVHLAPLVERDQLDGAADIEGVDVAGSELEDALLQAAGARRSRDAEDAGRDQVDGNQVEDQLVTRG